MRSKKHPKNIDAEGITTTGDEDKVTARRKRTARKALKAQGFGDQLESGFKRIQEKPRN